MQTSKPGSFKFYTYKSKHRNITKKFSKQPIWPCCIMDSSVLLQESLMSTIILPNTDVSIKYYFECTSFSFHSALTKSFVLNWCGEMTVGPVERMCCFGFWMSWRGKAALFFFIWFCWKASPRATRSDSPCPQVSHKSELAWNFSQIHSTCWPRIVLCPNIDPLKHSKLLSDAQTVSGLRHFQCLLQSAPIKRQKGGSESGSAAQLDVFYWTEYDVWRIVVQLSTCALLTVMPTIEKLLNPDWKDKLQDKSSARAGPLKGQCETPLPTFTAFIPHCWWKYVT